MAPARPSLDPRFRGDDNDRTEEKAKKEKKKSSKKEKKIGEMKESKLKKQDS